MNNIKYTITLILSSKNTENKKSVNTNKQRPTSFRHNHVQTTICTPVQKGPLSQKVANPKINFAISNNPYSKYSKAKSNDKFR